MSKYSNSISIFKGATENIRLVQSNCDFFKPNKDIIVKCSNEKIVFKNIHIDYNGKTIKPKALNCGWVTMTITYDLPIISHLEIDSDESNIDEIVVYFN